jgi:hypothetical protein
LGILATQKALLASSYPIGAFATWWLDRIHRNQRCRALHLRPFLEAWLLATQNQQVS